MTTVYVIKRGSQSVGAIVGDGSAAKTHMERLRSEDFERHRIQFRDLEQYDLTHRWWIEVVQVL